MNTPQDLKYTSEHEWVKREGSQLIVGITDYAQDQLGDIVYVELPEVGQEFKKDDVFGVVESTKSVSDLYMPVSGKVLETNQSIIDAPELINQDPYGQAWMLKLELSDESEFEKLLDAKAYQASVGGA